MQSGDILQSEEDQNTVKGAVFDHVGETAGLGAEITQEWFQETFCWDEKVFDKQRITLW